jgi:hypothetical protein
VQYCVEGEPGRPQKRLRNARKGRCGAGVLGGGAETERGSGGAGEEEARYLVDHSSLVSTGIKEREQENRRAARKGKGKELTGGRRPVRLPSSSDLAGWLGAVGMMTRLGDLRRSRWHACRLLRCQRERSRA